MSLQKISWIKESKIRRVKHCKSIKRSHFEKPDLNKFCNIIEMFNSTYELNFLLLAPMAWMDGTELPG